MGNNNQSFFCLVSFIWRFCRSILTFVCRCIYSTQSWYEYFRLIVIRWIQLHFVKLFSKPRNDTMKHKGTFLQSIQEVTVLMTKTHRKIHQAYSQHFFHVRNLDALAQPCFPMAEWVQRCCTELFHFFSLDSLFLRKYHPFIRKTRPHHFSTQLFIQGHGSGNLSIVFITELVKEVTLYNTSQTVLLFCCCCLFL